MTQELHYLTIREAADLISSGNLSPVELTQAFLDRIEKTDGRLHSYITILAEQALEEARIAEAEIRQGAYRGPLHGIPMAHKDLYDTAGVRTTAGSRVYADRDSHGRLHGDSQVPGGGRNTPGQAFHVRIRPRRTRSHHPIRPGPQPLEPGAHPPAAPAAVPARRWPPGSAWEPWALAPAALYGAQPPTAA